MFCAVAKRTAQPTFFHSLFPCYVFIMFSYLYMGDHGYAFSFLIIKAIISRGKVLFLLYRWKEIKSILLVAVFHKAHLSFNRCSLCFSCLSCCRNCAIQALAMCHSFPHIQLQVNLSPGSHRSLWTTVHCPAACFTLAPQRPCWDGGIMFEFCH